MSEEKVTHPFDRLVCCQKHIYNPDELAQQKGDNSSNVDAKFEAKVEIHPEVTKREAEMIENRNHFHRNPETAFKVFPIVLSHSTHLCHIDTYSL